MNNDIREEINSRINITDIVGEYLTLKKNGSRYLGLCPFHNENTPSFSVTPAQNLFYCFGCHKGGTVFDFIMEVENLTYPEALRFLAKKAGVNIPEYENGKQVDSGKREALKELYRRAAGSFSFILRNKPEASAALEYLHRRGLDDRTIDEFGIGWAPSGRGWLSGFLRGKGYSEGFLEESGLFSRNYKGYPLFSGRVMFPITNNVGEVIAFSGRTLEDNGPKYINSPETEIYSKKHTLYGLFNAIKTIRDAGSFVLCEGQMDVISCHQAGIRNVVAPLGTAFTEQQALILKRYAPEGVIAFDGDSAGIKAAEKGIILMEKTGIKSRVINLPKNEDPSDILINKGGEALQKIMKSTINSFDYILENAIGLSNIATPEGKEAVMRHMTGYLESLASEVRRSSCINEIADRLGVSAGSVVSDFIKGGRNPERVSQQESRQQIRKDGISKDLYLMIAVLVNRESFRYVRSRIGLEDLDDPEARDIFIALEECYRNDENDLDSVLRRIGNGELVAFAASRMTSEEFSINSKDVINDSVNRIRKKSLLKKRAVVERQLKTLSRQAADNEEEIRLLSEKIFIDKEIEKLRLGI